MRLRDWLTVFREYPAILTELSVAQDQLEQTQQALNKSEQRCSELNAAGCDQQYELDALSRKVGACMDVLRSHSPLHTVEDMARFYETVMPAMDPEGFTLYFTAKEMTGFHSCYAFPYEDNRGMFEEANGHDLMSYLLADHFGAVDWNIVPGTCYESATLLEVDKTTPEYQAFAKELYEKTLRKMGFGDLLPQEQAQIKEKTGSKRYER